MNSRNIIIPAFTLLSLIFAACNGEAQTNTDSTTPLADASIEVIQFHSEHRCMTCNKIEELSRAVLKDYPEVPFSLVNVDDDINEEKAEEFEAFGTALFLFNPQTGEKMDLTEFAFMTAGTEEKFRDELKTKLDAFLKP